MDQLTFGAGIGVHQQRKLFELRNQYQLTDEAGRPAGTVEQVEQSPFTVLARLFSDLDVALPVTLEVRDANGLRALRLHKPWFRFAVAVSGPDGTPLGHVRKRVRVGKAVFELAGQGGVAIGEVRAGGWRARDFAILDTAGNELARITKQWRGLFTEALTDADSYAVTFAASTPEPVRLLSLAAALAIDLTMKQKDTG